MNTDKLVPLDFSRSITPIAVGDKYNNKTFGKDNVITVEERCLDELNDLSKDWSHLFVTSYADRPNTGKQPVADDVFIDADYKDGDNEGPSLAKNHSWGLYKSPGYVTLKSWKPNHAAMVERYQASLADKEDERMNNIARNGNDGDHYDVKPELSAIETLKSFGYKYVDGVWSQQEVKPELAAYMEPHVKPVYTQEMCDAGEMKGGQPVFIAQINTLAGVAHKRYYVSQFWCDSGHQKEYIKLGLLFNTLEAAESKCRELVGLAPIKTDADKSSVKDSSIKRLGVFLRKNELVKEGEGVIDCVIRELAEKHDIDIRTDEERLRDAITSVLLGTPCSQDDQINVDVKSLMASDKFTITLKGK